MGIYRIALTSPAQMQNANADFGQRSRLALTHPVTLAALGVLLLNDLVLKSLWANPWTTGKLSDLAWVAFASPLLAFLLSLAARNHRRAQRAAFMAAYVGLPLLYAAFNTFAPVHDVIIRGLLLVSGGTSGSPLDPTDSLVIPVGLAIALWVWRRSGDSGNGGGTGTLRQRIVLLAAALATIASVATSQAEPAQGIRHLMATEPSKNGGMIYASDDLRYYFYESSDGGFTWQSGNPSERFDFSIRQSVDTPRGRFEIGEHGIMHISGDGSASTAYSTKHLKSGSSGWLQQRAMSPIAITTGPYGILYDPQSDNVIAAMGILGVVVGTPDGEWTPVAVGPFRPISLSFIEKVQALMTIFLVTVITLMPAAMAATIALTSIFIRRDQAPNSRFARLRKFIRRFIAITLSGVALLIAVGMLSSFDQPLDDIEKIGAGFFVTVTIMLSLISLALCADTFASLPPSARRPWIVAIIVAALAMIAEIFLMFVVWLQLNVSTDFAVIGMIILVIATGAALLLYLRSSQRSESESVGGGTSRV